ncbi:hypothetical protein Daesc_006241 [Daldinia eschscholtzii]|uniref:BPP domain-containing protein n=1 Tax=Daldinia eschscholtzii TaxID=292717 RepID=A0AAX6MG88_9PEZI
MANAEGEDLLTTWRGDFEPTALPHEYTAASVIAAAASEVDLPISARSGEVESDSTTVFYHDAQAILVGNDGGASTGGFRLFDLNGETPLTEKDHETPGRTKLVTAVHNIGGKDLVVTIAQPDSYFRLYDPITAEQVGEPLARTLGDWSALCSWKSQSSGEQYLYLFGKKQTVQHLLRENNGTYEIVEIQTFENPIEATSCAISLSAKTVYFATDDGPEIYAFPAAEATSVPQISVLGKVDDAVTGLAAYIGTDSDYILVAENDIIAVYDTAFAVLGSLKVTADEDIEVKGLNVYQGSTQKYPSGAVTYATKSDSGKGFAVSSLEGAFNRLGLDLNTSYDPHGWGGLYCAFKVVQPVAETDAHGGDGDDPAIWISPTNRSDSRIITTTKSEEGAGLSVFDLNGKLLQSIDAGEPDNVDVIYNFQAGNRTMDLAYAACRTDNTLCLFEITSNGTLQTIAGGSQPTKDGYKVYGSCVYRSRKSGKQYLFVNAKSAEYLQYELSWADDALKTTLVRNFTGGSGGQVEGCVSDEANGWVIIGEEPRALWRYGAEPDDDSTKGFLIGEVGDGTMYADVEGVTLVEGPSADKGFIIVSQQGVSAYNVYRRAAPHDYVETFTIYENPEKGIDGVTNTDGLTAVGAALGDAFPSGLVVTHDDANQLPEGGTSDQASYKLVSLGDILGKELMKEVDANWDPRK